MAFAGELWAKLNSPSDPPSSWSEVRWPASSLVFAAMGLALCVAASAGLSAAGCYSFFLLNTHLGLLALTMAGQVCLVAAVANSNGGSGAPGHQVSRSASTDITAGPALLLPREQQHLLGGGDVAGQLGGGGDVRAELRDALLAYKWADAVAGAVEVATLVFGCLLHSAFTRADNRAEDVEEGLAETSAPLLVSRRRAEAQQVASGRRTQLPPRVRRDDSWSRRMREQYGVDTSMLSYNPQAGGAASGAAQEGAAAAGSGPDATGGGRCVIS